jgi:hypothetical protein
MTQAQKIVELMQVSSDDRDLSWLQESLNAAVKLELSTLPPYLCGYWSIRGMETDPRPPVADLIQIILYEEMLHLSLACNMLTTIGGRPDIDTLVPTYPGPLPGGVRPDLTVYLSGLTPEFVHDVCMAIELPEADPGKAADTYGSIRAFYSAIGDAFRNVKPAMTGENQITLTIGSNSLYAIKSLADAEKAISEIKEQGEGTSISPDGSDFGGELAHYYKFGEIYYGKRFVEVDGKWEYAGDPVPFPDAYPMAMVPEGGWPDPSLGVQKLLDTFNGTFSSVLANLQNAWTMGNEGDVWAAVRNMGELRTTAQQLMRIPLPDESANYGPDFRVSS